MKEGFVLFFKKKLHLHFRQAKAWKRALCRKMGQRGVLMPISLTGSVKRRKKGGKAQKNIPVLCS